jgi:cell wall-associated NlpC family hydrolase
MSFSQEALADPDRIVVTDNAEWVATFTPGCYTVTLAGPARTFSETFRIDGSNRTVKVTHSTWVRAAPGPVDEHIDERWLLCALAANHAGTPDALAIAMQYIKNAPPILLGDLQIAGDASYGPLLRDGTRDEGSDFNDYLGLRWLYPADPPDRPEASQHRCLDCSGYMRMVWGYRHQLPDTGYPDTIPLSRRPQSSTTLPRRSFELYEGATGIILIEDGGTQATDLDILDAGDLVFFDVERDDGARLDHVGMYMGTDVTGARRFISSRETANGPTLADAGGRSILNGTGTYARRFRAARRL